VSRPLSWGRRTRAYHFALVLTGGAPWQAGPILFFLFFPCHPPIAAERAGPAWSVCPARI
jgi:hypothetical protein